MAVARNSIMMHPCPWPREDANSSWNCTCGTQHTCSDGCESFNRGPSLLSLHSCPYLDCHCSRTPLLSLSCTALPGSLESTPNPSPGAGSLSGRIHLGPRFVPEPHPTHPPTLSAAVFQSASELPARSELIHCIPLRCGDTRCLGWHAKVVEQSRTMITMEDVAGVLGIGVPVAWFLISFFVSIPASWLWRFVPGVQARHLYAAASGAFLSHCAFGAESNLYFMLPISVSYAAMVLHRRMCGVISAVFAFGFLIACHVMFMSGDAWKTGGIDHTGAMMVLTLKVTSAAFNYQDGLIKDEDSLREAQKKYRLDKLPSLIAYLGYCFNCGTHLAGPVFELRDYMEWTENKGLWDPNAAKRPPSPYGEALFATVKGFLCMGVYMHMTGAYPLSFLTNPDFMEWGYWHRVWYQFLCSFGARWKYYFIWSLSEAAVMISGFGFSGWTKVAPSEEPRAKWTRAQNVDILNVELATSAAEIPKYWNIHVSVWLRHYVYERLVVKGKRPGFRQLLATQVVSAVWHGLYSGYFLFFINSALMIAGARVIYKLQQAIPKGNFLAVNLATLFGFFYTAFVLNLTVMGFLVLYFADTMTVYRSVYYTGTLVPVAFLLLGQFYKPPRAGQNPKVKKES